MHTCLGIAVGLFFLLASPVQADGQRRVPSSRNAAPATEITASGVSPASLELRAGQSSSVTVTGSGLHRVTEGLVRRQGRDATRVKVELGPQGDGQSRSVRITLPATLGPLANQDLTLVLRTDLAGDIETPLELAAVAPELESHGFVASGNDVTGEDNKVSLWIHNAGRAAAGFQSGTVIAASRRHPSSPCSGPGPSARRGSPPRRTPPRR